MHPAKSVIFFTTASGAGYGLLIWLAVLVLPGWLPADRLFGFATFALALGLITGGLLSSTFHLGHPERAWRAMSQWRTSWLSREGVAALVTYVPAGLFGIAWVFFGTNTGAALVIGLVSAVMAFVTVYCTAMIYASLKTIRAWNNIWTRIAYVAFSLMTGAVLMHALARLFGFQHLNDLGGLALVTIALGTFVKREYWRFIDTTRSHSTAETATGLGDLGKVRLLEAPHTEVNYLMTEMGFKIARKHAAKLRNMVWAAAFGVPFILTAAAVAMSGAGATALSLLAVLSAGIGIVIERWLFFAEAQHVVTLYYGESTA
ncbi:MAG: dimethyl sulfoxide reductase anchor subunit [Hyphomicrobiales bacterium]|nr:dimethyl sulfoxide reductase anchor subunit [Hyphomicrobiales bacterium]